MLVLTVAFIALGLFIFRSGIFYADKKARENKASLPQEDVLNEVLQQKAAGIYTYENKFFAIEYPETWNMENITGSSDNKDMYVRLISPKVQTGNSLESSYMISFLAYAPEQFISAGMWDKEKEQNIKNAMLSGDIEKFIDLLGARESMNKSGHDEFFELGGKKGYILLSGNEEMFIRGMMIFLSQGHMIKVVINEADNGPLPNLTTTESGLINLLDARPYGKIIKALTVK